MSSLWNRSGIVERYADDIRADGAKAFFFQGGTTTPLTVYRDAGSSSAHPIPVVADSNGRWPDVFVPYVIGYDVQVKSKDDVQITFTLGVPNPDPVDLSVVIPAEERIQTGMMVPEFVNSVRPGYVRLNGRTIGNPSSLATERANTDTANLFNYLWNNLPDTIAAVSSGRGVSSTSDFTANKNIVLPTMQGMSLIGLDDMGNTAANTFFGLTFNTGSATQGGSSIGANSITLNNTQMPAHSHTGSTSFDGTHSHGGGTGFMSNDHTHTGTTNAADRSLDHLHRILGGTGFIDRSLNHVHHQTGQTLGPGGGGSGWVGGAQSAGEKNTEGVIDAFVTGGGSDLQHTHGIDFNSQAMDRSIDHLHTFTTLGVSANHFHGIGIQADHSHTVTTNTVGGTSAINNVQSSRLVTWFIKL